MVKQLPVGAVSEVIINVTAAKGVFQQSSKHHAEQGGANIQTCFTALVTENGWEYSGTHTILKLLDHFYKLGGAAKRRHDPPQAPHGRQCRRLSLGPRKTLLM